MAGPLWSCPAVIVLIVLAVALHLGHPLISNLRCSSSGRFRLGRRPFYHHRVMYSTTEDVISERPIVNNGTPHTEASRAKISAANKGKKPWNVGKQHSEETKRRIAEKTKEAMDKRKLDQAMALGFTVEEFDAKKIEDRKEKKRIKDATKVKGLTDDGRRRLSEGLKKRWENPEFRKAYLESTKGNRNHSDETRARISLAIKQKWMDEEYRAKINRYTPSADVRERISQTLKARWESPEFRDMMMNRSTVRTDAWRAQLSEKIRLKWEDPEYRGAVMHGIQNANRKNRTVTYRLRPESAGAAAKRMALEVRKKQRAAAAAEKERDRHRREMLRAAKTLAKRQQLELGVLVDGKSIKELLGKELWFEEKVRKWAEWVGGFLSGWVGMGVGRMNGRRRK